MSKCRVDGCSRSKDLSPDGFCKVCVRASVMRGPASSNTSASAPSMPSMSQPGLGTSDMNMAASGLDFSKIDQMAKKINDGETIDQSELMKGVFGLIYGVAKSIGTVDEVKTDVKSNKSRIKALEDKVGKEEEVALSLGLVIINLPLPPTGLSELQYARAVIKEVSAQDVDPLIDVTKAVRIGYKLESSPGKNDGSTGRVEIEVTNTEVKAKIMKTKKTLETHTSEVLRKIKIFNKKTQEQLNQEFTNRQLLRMIPGGSSWYIAGNGQLRQQTRMPNQHQNFPSNHTQYQRFTGPPPPRQSHPHGQAPQQQPHVQLPQHLPPGQPHQQVPFGQPPHQGQLPQQQPQGQPPHGQLPQHQLDPQQHAHVHPLQQQQHSAPPQLFAASAPPTVFPFAPPATAFNPTAATSPNQSQAHVSPNQSQNHSMDQASGSHESSQ